MNRGVPSPQPSPASGRGGALCASSNAALWPPSPTAATTPSPGCGRRWREAPDEGEPLRRPFEGQTRVLGQRSLHILQQRVLLRVQHFLGQDQRRHIDELVDLLAGEELLGV